ncbi:MAG: phage terminase large subunit, partial [Pyrinomonadaceae bacterium]
VHGACNSCNSATSSPNSVTSRNSVTSPTFPSRRANSEAEWETSQGGGLRAVGVGSGVTGFGASLIVVDDPVKSRAEAESQTFRDNLYEWFNDDLYTRLEPKGAIILIQTRWHEDDLAGRLIREMHDGGEHWDIIDLPALAETRDLTAETQRRREDDILSVPPASAGGSTRQETGDGRPRADDALSVPPASAGGAAMSSTRDGAPETGVTVSAAAGGDAGMDARVPTDPLGRSPGEALCPERFDVDTLERLRRKLGTYSFSALYQQRPVPSQGGLFKREWFRNILTTAPPNLRWKRGYDLGISGGADSDYTASLRAAYDKEGNLYIDGGFRARIEYPAQRKYILGRIIAEQDTEHGVELAANGTAVVQDLRRERNIRGQMLRGVKVTGNKISRALPWIALAEEGKVFLIRGPWNRDFIDEACTFPSGTHDDQIDAVSIAVRMCKQERGRVYVF